MNRKRFWCTTVVLFLVSFGFFLYVLSRPGSSQPSSNQEKTTANKPSATEGKGTEPHESDASDGKPVFDGKACSIGGCSIGHHSIPPLKKNKFRSLLDRFGQEPLSSESEAFEKLLYYGRQTRAYINQYGLSSLDDRRSKALKQELSITSAKVSFRITDETGTRRVRLDQKSVPLGKSKHFSIKDTTNVKPPELSGTVYRVGVNHLWARYWVEGVHFVNGPWFTVQQTGEWKELGSFWMSNGDATTRATAELKLELPEAEVESQPNWKLKSIMNRIVRGNWNVWKGWVDRLERISHQTKIILK